MPCSLTLTLTLTQTLTAIETGHAVVVDREAEEVARREVVEVRLLRGRGRARVRVRGWGRARVRVRVHTRPKRAWALEQQ